MLLTVTPRTNSHSPFLEHWVSQSGPISQPHLGLDSEIGSFMSMMQPTVRKKKKCHRGLKKRILGYTETSEKAS